ncbi:MAG: hypothetical protein IKT16_09335 [Desulfovibrio sp.]|nr:hypothetical protein [Desulfovibrio sp.]
MAGAFLTHSLGRLFACAVLACALALALVPGRADPAFAARTMTNDQIMALVRDAFDKESFEKGLEEVRWLKDAGFIYQPGLTVPRAGTCPMQDDWDSRAVLSGMVAADRTAAFLFGTYADVKRETETLHQLVPELPARLLAPRDQEALQQKLDTKRGRALLAERTMTLWDELLKRAGKSEKSLRFLGAYFYGDQIERFYLASVMILAAAETGDLDAWKVNMSRGDEMRDVLMALSREGLVGDAKHQKERDARIKELFRLVSANGYRPPLKNLQRVVKICQDERNRIAAAGR